MDWYEVLNGAILQVVQLALIVAIAYLGNLARKYVKNQTAKETLTLVEDSAKRAVTVVTQTYVDEARKNGEWNEDTARVAFELALMHAKETINEDAIKIAQKVTGDAEAYLAQLLEQEVKKQKEGIWE